MTMHADVVQNMWGEGHQLRLGTVTYDVPTRPHLAAAMGADLAIRWDGSYLFITTPHTDGDCPFAHGDRLDMKSVPVEGEFKLPPLPPTDDLDEYLIGRLADPQFARAYLMAQRDER